MALVLTRHAGEAIMIGNDIQVRILDVNRNQVRIGVEAPKDITVHREEIYNKIKEREGGA